MTNINTETKGPKGFQNKESLLLASTLTALQVAAFVRGLCVTYGADAYHAALPTVAAQASVIGIIEEDAIAAGAPISVVEFGQTVAQVGAAVTALQPLTNNAAGQLVPAQPGQPFIAVALESTPNAGDYIAVNVQGLDAGMPGDQVTHAVASGAIPVATGTIGLGSVGALAMTLAQPTNAQDGTIVFITAETAHAHTVTTAANGINGAKHIVTFAAQGDFVVLEALAGTWYARAFSAAGLLT